MIPAARRLLRRLSARSARLLRQPSTRRFGLLLLLLAGFGVALLLVPRPAPAQLPRLADSLGGYAPVAAVLGGALLLVALVPRTFVTLAAGAIFGPVAGAAYALGAALLGAAIGFAVGRLLGREFVAERVRGRLARLDGWFARQSVLGVITVRLLPIAGFGLVSYGYGTTGARVLPFLAGSVIAAAPTAVGYAVLGAAVSSPGAVNWYAAAPSGLGLIATVVIVHRWWRAERRRRVAPS
ncbi:VTT domain-containing protein [Micromonospora sp. DR5-3]|uniref:TVP38/TMEM64 family protein n=1 Tax=unclassified Micromonospora TaxID=2617518 RepID=UPI0011D7CF25|nr:MULTISPECIES: VTT domain-containing protein [unclassified Micromonospora]MCW3817359.1 VTT domain-containing protein [Micromonospora sp. DR5-3]TYC24014.1 TVP38/TMEM64 family protein [Micromonospora sp. MP36]